MSAEVKVPETLEEANALLKAEREAKDKAVERAIGAEKVIENHKKNDKNDPNPSGGDTFSKEDVEKMLSDRDLKAKDNDFFVKNPDLVEHKDKITEYTSKGMTHNEAIKLLEMRDPTIANRKNISQANFTSGNPGVAKKTITQEQLSQLKGEEFKNAIAMKKKGELKII